MRRTIRFAARWVLPELPEALLLEFHLIRAVGLELSESLE